MIRFGEPKDVNQILAIARAWPTHFVESAYPLIKMDFLEQQSAVVEITETVRSFVVWSANAVELEILWLATDPDYIEQGLASKLLEVVISSAAGQRVVLAKTATLDSVIPNTDFEGSAFEQTHSFFYRNGFIEGCRLVSYWSETNHCLIFLRRIG
jgi:ribosomal protein S18 acetylase RimI-like enzyme